jgi:hypothetical protein
VLTAAVSMNLGGSEESPPPPPSRGVGTVISRPARAFERLGRAGILFSCTRSVVVVLYPIYEPTVSKSVLEGDMQRYT